eukprot:TRINITY_DN1670_c1_g2_i2.p1 TRINITY_DN1670_c1_g2~~TRINITY_DN1670_c1_g2_i2.p1  ORF type:complete len:204 (+),score=69.62 TRINITY_DN1670_c1_g2_i2:282-893(+)
MFQVDCTIDSTAEGVSLHCFVGCAEGRGGHGVTFTAQEGVSSEQLLQVAPKQIPLGYGFVFSTTLTVPHHCVVSDESRGLYPIVLSLQANGGAEQKITYITIAERDQAPQAKRCVLLMNGNMFLLKEVFGGGGDEDAGEADCTVCLSSAINTVIMPCRHKALCEECASSLVSSGNSKCPICRTDIQYYMKQDQALPGAAPAGV